MIYKIIYQTNYQNMSLGLLAQAASVLSEPPEKPMLALIQRKSTRDKESSMGIEAIVTFQTLSLINLLTSLRLSLPI